jgi:hypothetical protein
MFGPSRGAARRGLVGDLSRAGRAGRESSRAGRLLTEGADAGVEYAHEENPDRARDQCGERVLVHVPAMKHRTIVDVMTLLSLGAAGEATDG